MPSERLSVVVTRRLPGPVEARMKELFDVRFGEADRPMSRDELAEAVAEADVLVPNLRDRIDNGLISRADTACYLIDAIEGGLDIRGDVVLAR